MERLVPNKQVVEYALSPEEVRLALIEHVNNNHTDDGTHGVAGDDAVVKLGRDGSAIIVNEYDVTEAEEVPEEEEGST